MDKKNLKLSGLVLAGIIIIVSFVGAVNIQPVVTGDWLDLMYSRDPDSYSYDLMSFDSYEDLTDFLKNCSDNGHYYYYGEGARMFKNIVVTDSADSGSITAFDVDYSETNIQVEGVDEPDFVKTDGTYLYIISGGKLFIVKARPAEDAKIVSKISVNFTITNLFVNGDRLVIFGSAPECVVYYDELLKVKAPWYSNSNTNIQVYDIEDRINPELKKAIIVGGRYFNARMIGDYVYVVTTQRSSDVRPIYDNNDTIVPLISINGVAKKIPLEDICCIDIPAYSYSLTHVVSVNIKDDEEDVIDKIFTLGNTQTMYVSKNNIYITYQQNRNNYKVMQQIINEVVFPVLPDRYKEDIHNARNFDISDYNKKQVVDWILNGFYDTLDDEERNEIESEIQRRIHRTVIHKISVNKGKIDYLCNNSVPGRVLNQFSMDEYKGFFRIATQIDKNWYTDSKSSTNVYILDENLDRVSEIENIAPGEYMHSARFMGDRAYLVTFKKVDPFFALDLSDPNKPEILGILKIPGYSDYLHPLDEDHIIGIGKDTVEALDESKESRGLDFAWYQGIKIAIFDVSDFENPKEMAKVVIGDRGTNSPVLYDHKAFLFDKEKELMVIPISLYEIDEEIKEKNGGYTGNTHGKFKFQGAYVYKVTVENGFEYRGRITHRNTDETFDEDYRWYWGSSSEDIDRSLYINDVLYTLSDNMIKMNSLNNLSEINSLQLK
jgi:uncharacterized secreted protein with C-terminal beta-propeller domain